MATKKTFKQPAHSLSERDPLVSRCYLALHKEGQSYTERYKIMEAFMDAKFILPVDDPFAVVEGYFVFESQEAITVFCLKLSAYRMTN